MKNFLLVIAGFITLVLIFFLFRGCENSLEDDDIKELENRIEKFAQELDPYVKKPSESPEEYEERIIDTTSSQAISNKIDTLDLQEIESELSKKREGSQQKIDSLKDILSETSDSDKKEEIQNEIDEEEEKISDIDKAMQYLSSLLKIAAYISAATGNFEIAAACFLVADGLDTTLEASNKEPGKGPSRQQAMNSFPSYKEYEENKDSGGVGESGSFEVVDEEPTVKLKEDFIRNLNGKGYKMDKIEGSTGDYGIFQSDKKFILTYKNEELRTIDYFEKNDDTEIFPESWIQISIQNDELFSLRYLNNNGQENVLIERSKDMWQHQN